MKSIAFKYIKNPYKLYAYFASKGLFKYEEDMTYLNKYYKGVFGENINWDNPLTFNEKLQWLKINDHNPLYLKMVDKYEAKQLVKDLIGEEYVIATYGVWNNMDEIDFSKLPEQFVIKCTHDSGSVIVCKHKKDLNYRKVKRMIEKSLNTNYYYFGREWPYKNVIPRIVIEKYMEDPNTYELRDYKFFCFGGIVKCFKIDFDRFVQHRANYYDRDGNLLSMGETACPPDYNRNLQLPKNLDLMIRLAELMSCNIPFIRIDFYEADGKVFFGEFTFFPNSGLGQFINPKDDIVLGGWINLPK